MITLLTLIPWVLTVAVLLFIIVRNTSPSKALDDDIFDDEDLMMDNYKRITIRVAVYDDKAYWVHDNVLYESEVMREPDWDTARPVDVMALQQKDVNKLMKVLDELQEKDERE